MKYNKFLDLVAMSAAAYDEKNYVESSKLMSQAFKSEDRQEAVEAMLDHNTKAYALRAANEDGIDDEPVVGDELRIEPDENKDREVQQGSRRRLQTATRRVAASTSAASSKKASYFDSLK